MRIGWKEVVFFLIVVIVILQAVHLFLLTRLKYTHNFADSQRHYALARGHASATEQVSMVEKFLRGTVLDSSGEFSVTSNLVTGDLPVSSSFDVTLVTQCSVDNLLQTGDLLSRWKGPSSIAVFLSEKDVGVGIERILALRRCYPAIAANSTFHLVFPMRGKDRVEPKIPSSTVTCDEVRGGGASPRRSSKRNYRLGFGYPGNLLRNVARRTVATEYFLVVDADMVTSDRLKGDFLEMTAKNTNAGGKRSSTGKVAYVVPAFETRSVEVPPNRTELVASWKRGDTRPFYADVCPRCQEHTDYANWLKAPQSEDMALLFEVMWKDPWEPFYIGETSSVPMYDERFRQYGFNRISQVCEMHVAGFSFVVVNNGFIVHKGWKMLDGFHPNKDVEQERNRELFRVFKHELKTRYAESQRRCY